jgi:hypothetical protein
VRDAVAPKGSRAGWEGGTFGKNFPWRSSPIRLWDACGQCRWVWSQALPYGGPAAKKVAWLNPAVRCGVVILGGRSRDIFAFKCSFVRVSPGGRRLRARSKVCCGKSKEDQIAWPDAASTGGVIEFRGL